MSDPATLYFLPWIRRGTARAIAQQAVEGLPTTAASTVTVSVEVDGTVVEKELRIRGPGDVIGVDPRQVVREEPEPGTVDFEANYFAAVELATADLPWMFTPAVADAQDRLIPWLALVVVEQREGVAITSQWTGLLDVLSVEEPAEVSDELPNLAEYWAWAHVQASVHPGDDLAGALEEQPEAFVARLLCPRRLEKGRSYVACLVPTFDGGRRAGLGLEVDEDDVALAWDASTTSIELPVYHSWSFRTGTAGDFESLAKKLTPRELGSDVGIRGLDVSQADPALPTSEGGTVDFVGALVAPSVEPRVWEDPFKTDFADAARTLLNASPSAEGTEETDSYDPLTDDPAVSPPAYGRLPSGSAEVPELGDQPEWLVQSNLDPLHRAGAGLGAAAVRANQEGLMASAWEQARALQEINRVLTRTRLASEVGTKLKTRVDQLTDGALVQVSRGAHARVKDSESGRTLAGTIARSALAGGLVSTAFRRVVRRGGTADRASGRIGLTQNLAGHVTSRFFDRPDVMLRYSGLVLPAGTVLADSDFGSDLLAALAGDDTSDSDTRRERGRADRPGRRRVLGPLEPIRRTQVAELVTRARVEAAAGRASRASSSAFAVGTPRVGPRVSRVGPRPSLSLVTATVSVELQETADLLRAELDPAKQLALRLKARVSAPEDAWGGRDIPPSMRVDPSFHDPAYEWLVALDPEFLVPGVGEVATNTVGLLEVNAALVEAFLLGANHELSREFVWREYPADLDGTWIRRFWDAVETLSDGSELTYDIDAVSEWSEDALGGHQTGAGADGTLVLLIKGELLRRYPDTVIYAVPALWDEGERGEDETGEPKHPLFVGTLGSDTVFLGFDLDPESARGSQDESDADPGWFFVFEENTSGARFGLDESAEGDPGTTPAYWENVSWGHLAEDEDAIEGIRNAEVGGRLSGTALLFADDRFREEWGANSSAMARITYQRPVRMLIHADSMLPDEEG